MTRILILHYSSYGDLRIHAVAAAERARSVPGKSVDIRRVPGTVPEPVRRTAGCIDDDTPVAEPGDSAAHDGIFFGTLTRFGLMAGQMMQFLDQAAGLWAQNVLVGKVAGVVASTGSQHGGQDATMLSAQLALLHLGMMMVGLPYSFSGQSLGERIVGGAPSGAGTIAGSDGSFSPGETDTDGARCLGARVSRVAAQRTAGSDMLQAV